MKWLDTDICWITAYKEKTEFAKKYGIYEINILGPTCFLYNLTRSLYIFQKSQVVNDLAKEFIILRDNVSFWWYMYSSWNLWSYNTKFFIHYHYLHSQLHGVDKVHPAS